MTVTAVEKKPIHRGIGRTLKTLVPLIQEELESGNLAGLENYRRAGAMLLEARPVVAAFRWGTWLSKNFSLSRSTAFRYMKLAQVAEDDPSVAPGATSYAKAIGLDTHKSDRRWQGFARQAKHATSHDGFKQERQSQEAEIRLCRELAEQIIDLGYRALAMRLHPDRRGGSKDAMTRLNRVRTELKSIAESRRFL